MVLHAANDKEIRMTQKINVLFLCTGNSCRSQMAEGWAKSLKLSDVEFFSAGIEAHGLNPNAIAVMKEAGIDISHHQSQRLSELSNVAFDYVFAVCDNANKNCPSFGDKTTTICHEFDDPPRLALGLEDKNSVLNCYREVRDQIKQWIQDLPQTYISAN